MGNETCDYVNLIVFIVSIISCWVGIHLIKKESYKIAGSSFFTIGILGIIAFSICYYVDQYHHNKQSLEYDVTATIVAINGSETYITQDKFHTPMACSTVLFKATQGFLFQVDCASATYSLEHIVRPQWVYSHNIGDTVHFEYISKKRIIYNHL